MDILLSDETLLLSNNHTCPLWRPDNIGVVLWRCSTLAARDSSKSSLYT